GCFLLMRHVDPHTLVAQLKSKPTTFTGPLSLVPVTSVVFTSVAGEPEPLTIGSPVTAQPSCQCAPRPAPAIVPLNVRCDPARTLSGGCSCTGGHRLQITGRAILIASCE